MPTQPPPSRAIAEGCRNGTVITDGLSRTQNAPILPEPDVLRLIVRSTLPAAQRFERWVFEDVLPSIRKMGG